MSDEATAALFKERNKLARELADLRDDFGTVKAEFRDLVERIGRDRIADRIAIGMDEQTITEQCIDSSFTVLDRVKDHCWNQGYLEGVRAARDALAKADIEAAESFDRDPRA